MCGIYSREEGGEEGRGGRKRKLGFWEKPEQESARSVVMGLLCAPGHMHHSFFICQGFVSTSESCAIEKKVCENEELSTS